MGTGSFGGGSGSLGGGSGGGGGGGGGGGASGSLQRAIKSLLDMSKRLRKDPDQARLTKEVIGVLQDRGRRSHIQDLFRDDLTNDVLKDMLVVARRIQSGATWAEISADFDLVDGPGAMRRLADAIVDRNYEAQSCATDERHVDRISSALNSFLLETVANNHRMFSTASGRDLDMSINRQHFANVIGRYMANLIVATIKADTVHDIGASWASVATATETVANVIYDRFEDRFVARGRAQKEEALRVISENFSALLTS